MSDPVWWIKFNRDYDTGNGVFVKKGTVLQITKSQMRLYMDEKLDSGFIRVDQIINGMNPYIEYLDESEHRLYEVLFQ